MTESDCFSVFGKPLFQQHEYVGRRWQGMITVKVSYDLGGFICACDDDDDDDDEYHDTHDDVGNVLKEEEEEK